MNILVTGGAGYIGSFVVRKLLSGGHSPIIFDNLTSGFKESIPQGAQFVHGDVLDYALLVDTLKKNKIDVVVHLAAKLTIPESVKVPLLYYENNTLGVLNLSKACLEVGVSKIVFSSTAAVYGNVALDSPIPEGFPLSPVNPYGFSKMMSEQVLSDCDGSYGLKSVSLRYFNVAGASLSGDNGQRTIGATHLVKVVAEVAVGKRNVIEIYGDDYPTCDGTGVRDFIHVEDLADLHVKAVEYLADGGVSQVFNCGYGKGFSVKEVIASFARISNREIKAVNVGRRPGDVSSVVADSQLAKNVFGWTPKYADLDLICRTAYEWELNN